MVFKLFAILQKYDFSSKSQQDFEDEQKEISCLRYCKSTIFQANHNFSSCCQSMLCVVCDTAKVRFFKQITTKVIGHTELLVLFAILQKYDFSSKSQLFFICIIFIICCLRYCKSTIFQANHNIVVPHITISLVVCDTAKVRFFKQITTSQETEWQTYVLFAILQKYDFSSKSQQVYSPIRDTSCCLRYCKSTIFQANHNTYLQ